MLIDTANRNDKFSDNNENRSDLDYLKKLLLLASLEISKKNRILSEINKLIKSEKKEFDKTAVCSIIQAELSNQENITNIELVRQNNNFFEKLEKYFPKLSELDRQLCAYCLANLSSKDISIIRGVEIKTIEMARYRLRRKLKIPKSITIQRFLEGLNKSPV